MTIPTDLLRPGDIVFIRIDNLLYRQVAAATGSWTSHVGIVIGRDANGEWTVAESAVPRVRLTPLTRFQQRSQDGRIAVRRLREPWSEAALERLRAAANTRLGRWYHFGFDLDRPGRQYCSRFVYEVVREAMGIEVGSVETFAELLARDPSQGLWFWRTWFFGRIPWTRRTVTPASQLQSAVLEDVGEWSRGGS